MGSSILHVIVLVILVSSAASARKCYQCVHATGYDLSELPDIINTTMVTQTCSNGTSIPAAFEHECSEGDAILNVIRQTVNAASPEMADSVNSILDQLSAQLAKKPKQTEYACATIDAPIKLNLNTSVDLGTVTGRICVDKGTGLDGSVCERNTGQQFINQLKDNGFPEEILKEAVAQITAVWTNFLESSIGVCVCESDLCVKKAGSGVIEVFAPLTIISALLSMFMFRN